MNKEQQKILEKRKSEITWGQVSWWGIMLMGIVFTFSLLGAIIGLPMMIFSGIRLNSFSKEKTEIKYKLAGK